MIGTSSAWILCKEMALGFTSDIAKNNLGESFYRQGTQEGVVFWGWYPFVQGTQQEHHAKWAGLQALAA